jgi:outer membrane protein
MKQVSLIFNLFLSIAIAVLFYLHFSEGKTNEPLNSSNIPIDQVAIIEKPSSSIVYVNSDTLWGKYKLIIDLQNQLAETKRAKESYLVSKGQKLEEDAYQFQMEASQMTEPQMILNQAKLQQTQVELQSRQQQLMEEQQRIEKNFFDEQQTMGIKIRDELSIILKQYSVANSYQLILAYSSVSDLLYAPDSLDITNDLVNSLNLKYQADNLKEE